MVGIGNDVQPKCPYCQNVVVPAKDLLYTNAGGSFKGMAVLYCGFCGAILGGSSATLTLTKTRRG